MAPLNPEREVLLAEFIAKQLPDVAADYKLQYNDLKRISKYIKTSAFDDDVCCMWTGYITNENNTDKGTYINFYFNNRKAALHRLMYTNFVGPLDSSEYLKFNCANHGKCCNVKHLKKYEYQHHVSKGTGKKQIAEARSNYKVKPVESLRICFD